MKKIVEMYADGFRNLDATSRTLWIIIIVKLIIMFGVLKVLFYPGAFSGDEKLERNKPDVVYENIMKGVSKPN